MTEQKKRGRGRPPKNQTKEVEFEKTEEAPEPTLKGTTTVSNPFLVSPGDEVTLNPKKSMRLNAARLYLNVQEPFGNVPVDASPQELAVIDRLVRDQTLIRGHQKQTIKHKDPQVVEFYVSQLDRASHPHEIRDAVIGLTKTRTRISNWTPKEILVAMRDKERDNKARPNMLSYLMQAISACTTVGMTNSEFNPEVHAKAEKVFKPEY